MSKMYYNGVLLPELPSDITSYPYLFILRDVTEDKYKAYGSSHPFYVDNNLTTSSLELRTFDSNSEEKELTYYECTGDSWVIVETLSAYGYLYTLSDSDGEKCTLIWTNTDIPYDSEDSTEIYMYADEVCYSITKKKLSKFGDEIRRLSKSTEKMETNDMINFLENIENGEGVGF